MLRRSPAREANDDVVQVKYTNQMSLFFGTVTGKVYNALIGSDPWELQKGPGWGTSVLLLPDQVKRDKGVWWMPWQ